MAKRASPDCVVDLTLDDSEDEGQQLDDIRKRLNYNRGKKVKVEGAVESTRAVHYDDVEVVQASAPAMTAAMPPANDNDIDVVMVGTVNEVNLPHMRPHCTKYKFNPDAPSNAEHCDLCYCYVCDCPVKDCKNWDSRDKWSLGRKHCNASDRQHFWVMKRRQQKQRSNPTSTTNTSTPSHARNNTNPRTPSYARNRYTSARESQPEPTRHTLFTNTSKPYHVKNFDFQAIQSYDRGHGFNEEASWAEPTTRNNSLDLFETYEPNHPKAKASSTFNSCFRCGWFSAWSCRMCRKCGRFAKSSPSLEQSVAYKPKPDDIFLGTREISFEIVAGDVRMMPAYKDSWAQADSSDPAWTFDDAEMKDDVFKHMLGRRPKIDSLLYLVSQLSGAKTRELARAGSTMHGNKDPRDAAILTNHCDLAVMKALAFVDSFATEPKRSRIYGTVEPFQDNIYGDLEANFKKSTGCGTIKLRVFLGRKCLSRSSSNKNKGLYSVFLGAWLNVFPLNLVDLTGPLNAKTESRYIYYGSPYGHHGEGGDSEATRAATKKVMERAVKKHNHIAKIFRSQLSLTSSSGGTDLGGVTSGNASTRRICKQYFGQRFPDLRPLFEGGNDDWQNVARGVVSNHQSGIGYPRSLENKLLDFVLNFRDRTLAAQCMDAVANVKSMAGVLENLENLGHGSEESPEGLNCELLPFQKQSLKWALERETVKDGIQSYSWMKVPVWVGSKKTSIYYSPILEKFQVEKPQVVRGGIIAEEMGLGKTVISLALILKNPAPNLPASGSLTTSLQNHQPESVGLGSSQWIKDLPDNSRTCPQRATILSRGTLVICPVSLVGQWIEEAKSKLKNPGLVYPYHGQTRSRDANILARNAIVVTTYQVLASDDTFHRKKSDDPDYCPPLEQIRWWRIICDEGHSLRQANTQRNASISNLVADHKWLVSGTPINTSIKDLKNQLSFLGIEHVAALFGVFCDPNTARRRRRSRGFSDEEAFSSNDLASPGDFLFLLRNVMMRHTQKQKYLGTQTTLMSLPGKTERTVEVCFTADEKKEYDVIDAKAKAFYLDFKEEHRHDLSSHYLKLSQRLTPIRVACSGGLFPLDEASDENLHKEDEDCDESDGEDVNPRKKRKKEVKYSDFAFTSKFKVLLSALERIRDKDPSSKSLVFSQFTSTLNWLKEELPKHGFQFRTLSGDMSMRQRSKALHDFQSDPPTTIFLLSMRAGNCGINLTQANRVFLMEPGFNPALEQQAIGRVHRLGQKRPVEIVRLLAKDSIETRIQTFLKHKYGSSNGISGSHEKDNEIAIGPLGNQATERPKCKILAAEFDILFGVKADDTNEQWYEEDEDMQDAKPFLPVSDHNLC